MQTDQKEYNLTLRLRSLPKARNGRGYGAKS